MSGKASSWAGREGVAYWSSVWSSPVRRLAIITTTALVAVLAGVTIFAISYPVTSARFPAFEMTYEDTSFTADTRHTVVYHLVYENDRNWNQAWVSSTTDDGTGTRTTTNTEHIYGPSSSPSGYHVPGPWWLVDEQGYIGRGQLLSHAIVTSEKLGPDKSDDGRAYRVVTITRAGEQTEMRFDAATGIPVRYELRFWGEVVSRHTVTSLVLANGQKIR